MGRTHKKPKLVLRKETLLRIQQGAMTTSWCRTMLCDHTSKARCY